MSSCINVSSFLRGPKQDSNLYGSSLVDGEVFWLKSDDVRRLVNFKAAWIIIHNGGIYFVS